LEDLGIDGRVILKWELVDWIHLVQDRDQWQTCANTVINVWVP
jgi:hypothetical protein